MKALDLSWGSSQVTPEWCRARLAEGWELLIADLWSGKHEFPDAARALRYWREAGGTPAAYYVVHDGRLPSEHTGIALRLAGEEWPHLAFVAVDVEVVETSPPTVREACRLVEQHGQREMVYTRASFWREHVGNSDALRDVPLWDASYGQALGLEMRPPYGGWERRHGHQYQNTTRLDGIDVCMNWFDGEWVRAKHGPDASRERDWQTVIDVTRGFGRELLEADETLTLAQLRERLPEAGRQLGDVAGILERLRAGE